MGIPERLSGLDRRVLGRAKPYRETRPRDLWLILGVPVVIGAFFYALIVSLDTDMSPAVALGPAFGGVLGGLIGYRIRRHKDRVRREASQG